MIYVNLYVETLNKISYTYNLEHCWLEKRRLSSYLWNCYQKRRKESS